MARKKKSQSSLIFVEHYYWEGSFVTDIWYNETTDTYSSVVSDLDQVVFSDLEDIKLYLDGTMEKWKNGSN